MNTTENNQETSRPLGFWLKAVDRLMAAEFASAFESFGVTRRDWRLLNRIDGTVTGGGQPLSAHKLRRLIDLGWVTDADGTWTLTDEGRDAKDRLGVIVDGIRTKVNDAVPAEDLATTMATLEQIARALGWNESTPLPRRGHRRFGPRGFGPWGAGPHGFGRGQGHGHGPRDAHGAHGHRGHVRARFARFAQGAYERGFDAGFTRGRDDR